MKPTQEQVIAWAREAGLDDDVHYWSIRLSVVRDLTALAYEAGCKETEENIRHSIAATPFSVQTRVYIGDKEVSMLKMTHDKIKEVFK